MGGVASQALVDALADRLARPVGVDDRRFRLVAYSSHAESVDEVRLASILRREAPRAVTAWLESLGVATLREPLRLGRNPALGMAARVCVPLRFDGHLLGYLWLFDEPSPLTNADLRDVVRCCGELSAALYRERLLETEDREQRRRLLARALEPEGGDARRRLVADGHLAATPSYAVIAAHRTSGDDALPDLERAVLEGAAEQVARSVGQGQLAALVDGERVVAAVALDRREGADRTVRDLAGRLRDRVAASGAEVVVGVSAPHPSVDDLAAARHQAVRALDLAMRPLDLGPVAEWDRLGAYRTIGELLGDRDPAALLPAGLRRLLASPDAETLVPTLEGYLEHGGDARAAAAQLFLHRSSLYHRLRRIEAVAGVDLAAGDERLELHLGLRLWRLAS